MKIHGLQKMTLLDYPGKVACTVFLGGCNFRCPFCHNFELVTGAAAPETDDAGLLAFLAKRRGLLDGVCVTGGEPLLHASLPALLRKIKALGFAVKLDTNGTGPDALAALIGEGLLDYVAMDVKHAPDRYAEAIGAAEAARPDIMKDSAGAQLDGAALQAAPAAPAALQAVRRSIALLLASGIDCEFRTTVVAGMHDVASIRAIAAWIRGARRYFIQPFVDRDTVPARGLSAPDDATLDAMLAAAREFVPAAEIRGK